MEDANKIHESRLRRKNDHDDRRNKKQQDAEDLAEKQKAAREKGLLEAHGRIN